MDDQDPTAGTAGLLGADDIHALAARAGIRPTKKLGQNFMIDPSTVRRIVRTAGVRPGDRVLEVGPGLGSLTLALLEAGAKVTAVEIDPRLAALLPQTVAHYQPGNAGNLSVIVSDALRLDAAMLAGAAADHGTAAPAGNVSRETFRLVSNLPYNVATPILLTLLARFPGLAAATVLVQDEVADRLTAGPGSRIYGVPSVKLAWFGSARKAGTVARSVFWPVPNVDSSLVSFERTAQADSRPQELREKTFALIDRAFGQRRKTLRAALKKTASADQIAAAGIDPSARGETLVIDDYLRLTRILENDGQSTTGTRSEAGEES